MWPRVTALVLAVPLSAPTLTFPQLVIKLQTKSGTEHFLEACSREERDNWADDITSAVNKLGSAGGDEGTGQEDPAGHRLHNVNLRWDAGSAAADGSLRTATFVSLLLFSSAL